MGKTKRKIKTDTMANCDPFTGICEEPPADETMQDDEMMMDEDMDDMEKEMDMMPQLVFLMTSMGVTAMSALDLFWRKHAIMSEQQPDADSADTEEYPLYYTSEVSLMAQDAGYDNLWWQMSSKIGSYAMLVLGATKMTTQLLSMLGIMGSVNLMVWHYGMMASDIVMLVTGVMMFMAYNKAYSIAVENAEDAENSNADFDAAMAVVEGMETDMAFLMVSQAAMHLELMHNYEGWFHGQVMMLPEEEQEAWMEMMGKDDMDDMDDDHHDDDKMDLFAFWRI